MSDHNDPTREFVDAVEDYWSRHGMNSTDGRRLAAELEHDLRQAIEGDVTPADVLRDDPADFARSLAAANGIDLQEPRSLTTGALVRNGLVGGLIGALVAFMLVYQGPAYALIAGLSDLAAPFVLHLLAALVTLGGVALGMWWPFKHEPRIVSTVLRATFLTALAGALSVPLIMLFAATTNYSTAPLVVLIEIGIAAAFCGIAIFTAAKNAARHPATSQ